MKIVNSTRKTNLSEKAEMANTPLARMKGLLGRDALLENEALIIKPCNSVHTFFMRFAIDAVFLSKDNIVVGLLQNLKPYRLSPIYFNAFLVIELPPGVIKASSTQINDKIDLD